MEQKLFTVSSRLVSSNLTHFLFTFICQETFKYAVNITTQHMELCSGCSIQSWAYRKCPAGCNSRLTDTSCGCKMQKKKKNRKRLRWWVLCLIALIQVQRSWSAGDSCSHLQPADRGLCWWTLLTSGNNTPSLPSPSCYSTTLWNPIVPM